MKVYHASYMTIDEIDLSLCEVGKDFGRGFYVTNLHKQAEIWAKRKGGMKRTMGVVTEFDFNENICRIMKLNVHCTIITGTNTFKTNNQQQNSSHWQRCFTSLDDRLWNKRS